MSAVAGAGRSRPATPWSRRDVVRAVVGTGVGGGLIGLSWFFAAGRGRPGGQFLFVCLALAGAVLGVATVSEWLRTGRSAVRVWSWALLGDTGDTAATGVAPASSAAVVARLDGKWMHRSDCLLAQGRNWAPAPLAEHQAAGRRPCRASRPGAADGVSS